MPVSVAKADIEQVWRPLNTEETSLVPGLSNKAWRRVLAHFPDMDSSITFTSPATAPLVSPDLVKDVMTDMIVRVLKNPDSVRSDAIDDHTTTLDAAISSGEMYLTADEVALLTPRPAVPFYGMYVMGLGG